MWTLEFSKEQESIGTLVALFDGVAVLKGSVNITDEDSVADFVAKAKESVSAEKVQKNDEAQTNVDSLLTSIITQLNK